MKREVTFETDKELHEGGEWGLIERRTSDLMFIIITAVNAEPCRKERNNPQEFCASTTSQLASLSVLNRVFFVPVPCSSELSRLVTHFYAIIVS